MKKFRNLDLFDKLKLDIVKVCIDLTELKQIIVMILLTNNWILEDINLFENYAKLQQMIKESDKDLKSLIDETIKLENGSMFLVEDIISEFNLIRENIYLEVSYLLNMLTYMMIVDNPLLNLKEIEEKLDVYNQMDDFCFNNMKLNNKQLKILKKERGDHIE